MARPEKPIDWHLVDQLIIRQNTVAEVASHFDMYPSNFGLRIQEKYGVNFTTYASVYRSKGVSTIKDKMYEKGIEEGNMTALTKLFDTYVDEAKPHAAVGAPLDTSLDKDHENMALKNTIQELQAKIADITKTG